MSFEDFLNQGWDDHATDAAKVWARLPEGLALIQSENDVGPLAHLAQHVAGEHLGLWQEGRRFLEQLIRHPRFDAITPSGKTVYRSLAVLARGEGDLTSAATFEKQSLAGGDVPAVSDRVRILAQTASAFAGQRRVEEAEALFREALELASYGPKAKDPAARALAVTGNNLAAELEDRPGRTPAETKLMLLAAETGRKFWEIAGGWTEVERAEYRLAMSAIAAGDGQRALKHARECVGICEDNRAVPYEHFYGWEAMARAAAKAGDSFTARSARDKALDFIGKMKAEAQPECRKTLERLDRDLGL